MPKTAKRKVASEDKMDAIARKMESKVKSCEMEAASSTTEKTEPKKIEKAGVTEEEKMASQAEAAPSNNKKAKQSRKTEATEEEKSSQNEQIPSKIKKTKQSRDNKKAETISSATEGERPSQDEATSSASTGKKTKQPRKANKVSTTTKKTPVKLPMRSVLQFKVTIRDVTPPIWRRIQVLNNDTFYDLRCYINEAMGWMSDRSHQFIVHDPKKNSNILIVNGALEGLTYDFKKDRGRLFKEQTTKLWKHFSEPGDMVLYEFDLGDCWMHEILLERVLPPAPPKAEYPKCTGGKRACPPEDCGGVDAYQHLLEVYKDPNHNEYEGLIKDWLFDMYPGFDPENFDQKKIFKKVRMWVLG